MEDLINNKDFDLGFNSMEELDRTLMSYPNEKSSFQVFLGADGDDMYDYSYFEKEPQKRDVDTEKIAEGITATAGAIGSIAATAQAFKRDTPKQKSRRRELKDVCGRKPILKKNRAEGTPYAICVQNYNSGKVGGSLIDRSQGNHTEIETEQKSFFQKNKNVIIVSSVLLVIGVTAFVGYKKGWFNK